ncbi:hypothetical protein [Streptomyces pseudogriseolus]|uniref:hypothetical protein n=1 Tax=Streptomyces pseudogriseolus TaxID=36817 RepID=UPI003FA3038C
MAEERDWELSRTGAGWALTNTSGMTARSVHVEFQGTFGGRPWQEGVTPAGGLPAVGVVPPGHTVRMSILNAETTHTVHVRWTFGLRRRLWSTRV